jgi:Predicted transcription factor, homolog of eukaryotic MBF1
VSLKELFGKRLKYLREQKPMTQEQLAAEAGLHDDASIRGYESGKNAPRFETIEKLAKALDVKIKELFNFD